MATFNVTPIDATFRVQAEPATVAASQAAVASASAAAASASAASAAAAEALEAVDDVTAAGAAQIAAVSGAGAAQIASVETAGAAQIALASEEADRAEAAALSSSGLLTSVGTIAPAAIVTLGSTTPNTTTGSNDIWSNGEPLPQDSVITAVGVRLSAAATVELLATDPMTGEVFAKTSGIAGASGVNAFPNPFGASIIPRGAIINVRVTAGTGRLRFVNGGLSVAIPNAEYVVGGSVPVYSKGTNSFAISVTASATTDALAPRLAAVETDAPASAVAKVGEGSPSVSRTFGTTAATVAGNVAANQAPGQIIPGDAIITGCGIRISGAARGYFSLWTPSGSSHVLARRQPVALVDGVNAVTIPRWFAPAGSFLIYESLAGNNATFASGGTYNYLNAGGQQDTGEAATVLFALNFTVNISVTVEVAAKPSYRANRAAVSGPTVVTFEQFPGIATPAGWSIAAPFTVSNGLSATGAGGWDKIATYQPNGQGWSSVRKRRLAGIVTITDPASIIGICTQPRTTVAGDGGAVAVIDGVANEIRLFGWTGTSGAGTQRAAAAIPALVAGRQYLFTVLTGQADRSATLTDMVTGTVTTVSHTGIGVADPRFHGRPGVMHLAGAAKWEWLNFAHNTPRNCRAVMIGDSNGEREGSWVFQLDQVHGGFVNAARAGETSTDMASRLSDLTDLRPQFAIMAMGTNDGDIAVWRSNAQRFIDAANAIGAEPILVIPPPQVAKQALMTAISSDITGYFFGRYRYIDFLGALSNNNDRLTWNPALAADTLHMNAAGQTRALAQAIASVPELTWGPS